MKQKTLRADLHIHTHYSTADAETKPEELVKKAREIGLDVIGVTDHGTIKGALDTQRVAHGNPLVLIGQEVRTKQGEIIVFGPRLDIEQKLDLLETCRTARKLGGFIIIPHPFDPLRQGIGPRIKKIKKYIDAVEVYNPRSIFNHFNKKAEAFALENNLPSISGTDAHFPEELGSAATLIRAKKPTPEEIFRAIKNKQTSIVFKKRSRFSILKTCLRRVSKKL
jgi:predicted metal-dependent phosphoesterase TrpH